MKTFLADHIVDLIRFMRSAGSEALPPGGVMVGSLGDPATLVLYQQEQALWLKAYDTALYLISKHTSAQPADHVVAALEILELAKKRLAE